MKATLTVLALIFSLTLIADTEALRIGFEQEEGYSVGKIIGQRGWTTKDSRHSAGAIANVTNIAAQAKSGSQYLCMRSTESGHPYIGRSFKIPGGVTNLYVVFEGDFRPVEDQSNWVKLLSADEREIATIISYSGSSSHSIYLDCYNLVSASEKSIAVGSVEDGQYCHYRLVCDPYRKLIVSFSLNDIEIASTANCLMAYQKYASIGKPVPNRMVLECDMDADNLVISTTPAQESGPTLVLSPQILTLGRNIKTATLKVLNLGSGSFDYAATATASPEWLSLTPTNGSCQVSSSITLKLDRAIMTNGYYRATVVVDAGAAGVKEMNLAVASGNVLLYENFESPYMLPGEITGQGKWNGKKNDGYGQPYNEMLVTNAECACSGALAWIKRASGWDGYTCEVNSDAGAVVKVSMKLFWNSWGDEDSFSVHQNYWNNCSNFQFWRYDGGIYLYNFNYESPYQLAGEYQAPLDQWFDFSFTLDFRSYKLTSVTFCDFTTNYADGIPMRNLPSDFKNPATKFTKLAFSAGGESTTNAAILVDNILIEQPDRPDAALPTWKEGLSFGSDLNSLTNTIVNEGTKKFSYTLSVLDYPNNVTPKSATGTVATKGNIIWKLSRRGLEDGFYRTRVAMAYQSSDKTDSGALTSLVTFAQGGYYYASEFEGPAYKLGPIGGQDTWTATQRGEIPPMVSLLSGVQCLDFQETSEVTTPIRIPAEAKVSIKFSYFFEENDNTCYLRLTPDIYSKKQGGYETGVFPIYVMKEANDSMAKVCYRPSGEEEFSTICESELGVWHDLSLAYDADVANSCVESISVDDFTTNFYEGQVVLNPDYDGLAPDVFAISTANYGEEEGILTGIQVDNFRVYDSDIPEPAAIAILALALLLKLRRS